MNIERAYPPNYDAIKVALPESAKRFGVLYAYGSTIYNPDGVKVDKLLYAHECKHGEQHAGLPVEWWKLYLALPEFRFDQELEAHRAEWEAFIGDSPNRHMRRVYLNQIAHRLASNLYGGLCTVGDAKRLIAGKGLPREFLRVASARAAFVKEA